ncbi:protein NETWORKED 2A-like [Senna tora]|uniref:Protein NETWORKED 2A-like n=1 Tax=Senna tora TaxID=362788 RepID=A0A834TGN8_9FABA|nr:protein NETWORKED 2A-like [Senna tora]
MHIHGGGQATSGRSSPNGSNKASKTIQCKLYTNTDTDMEEKVEETLRILEDDGDSFAKRAEMYYKKRPELVTFVEETFRAYRALAERYDYLSKELQSANRTIASVFPDQVQYSVDEEDEGTPTTPSSSSSNYPTTPAAPKPGIPMVPRTPNKDFRSHSMLISRKGPPRRTASSARPVTTSSSGLTKGAALEEIDKLQKEILGLQTEKEFVRSLYERAYDKYWEIEDQITEKQKRVCSLQDEFGVGTVIEDQDARTLMAATALKSCHETLVKLQEVQEKASEEAKVEYQRLKEAHDEFETLRDQFLSKHANYQDSADGHKCESTSAEHKSIDEKISGLEQETHDVEQLREKIKEQLEVDSSKLFTVTEMAERIDELVNKVVTLETAVSSQTGLVKRLRSETDELKKNIRSLQEDKEMLIKDSGRMSKKLKELEEELKRVKNLQQNVKYQNKSLQTHFTEASCNLEHLSGRLHDVKQDEEVENLVLYKEKKSAPEGKSRKASEGHLSVENSKILEDANTTMEEKEEDAANLRNGENNSNLNENVNLMSEMIQKTMQQDDLSDSVSNADIESQDFGAGEGEGQPNWRQMFINGLDDREKILLEEYTLVLRNYRDVRMRLNDVEKKNRESIFELALQVRELKNTLVTKDKEINFLHQKMVNPDMNPDEIPLSPMTEYKYTPQEVLFLSKEQAAGSEISAWTSNAKYSSSKEDSENQEDKPRVLSPLEQKLRSDIDDVLEENLDFWMRFSTSVHQIQKFQNSIQDLQAELLTIKEHSKAEGNSKQSIQSEVRPIFRHLREIRTELSLWLEHNAVLRDELRGRDSSLRNIQDEISKAYSRDSETDKSGLSEYQAAKFQGEILNMKQENKKVAGELQTGLGHVRGLKNEVEKTLAELDHAFGINAQPQLKHSGSRMRIPLRSFLFGVKLKKQKQSIFSCVNPMQNQFKEMEASNNAPI